MCGKNVPLMITVCTDKMASNLKLLQKAFSKRHWPGHTLGFEGAFEKRKKPSLRGRNV